MNTPGQTPAPPRRTDGKPDWDAFADLAQRAADFERLTGRKVAVANAIERDRRARRAMIAQEHADAIARAKRPPAPRHPLLPRLAPWIAPVLASLMLLLALTTCEDGYYILLRWVVFATAGWIALQLHKASRPGWFWIMLLLALLYNPLIPVHLGEAYTPRITRTTRLYRSRVAVEYADEGIWSAIYLASIPLLLIANRLATRIRPDKTVPHQTTTTATPSTADSRHTPTNTGLTAPPPTAS